MPLAYFHFENGRIYLDRDGVDLPNLKTIQAEATATVAAMLHEDGDTAEGVWSGRPLRLWVTDAPDGGGKTLFTLRITSE